MTAHRIGNTTIRIRPIAYALPQGVGQTRKATNVQP